MPTNRSAKLNEGMRQAVAEALRSVKDPRVGGAFITVTGCEVTADCKYAKVYYSAYGADPVKLRDGLKSSLGFIRSEVAHGLNLRVTPELTFIPDKSMEHGAKISRILKELDIPAETEEPQ